MNQSQARTAARTCPGTSRPWLENCLERLETRSPALSAAPGDRVALLPVYPPPPASTSSAPPRRAPRDVGAPPRRTSPEAGGQPPPVTPPLGRRFSPMELGDLVGGRALAWIGGAAMLLGIVLFLALAISHGWIGREARVALAAVACGALMAGGIWLHARRGRTEAAVVAVGTATSGWFTTLFVAGHVFQLIPSPLAVAGAMLVGGFATWLEIRWAARRAAQGGRDEALAGLGVGAHVALVLVRALVDLPPRDLGAGVTSACFSRLAAPSCARSST